MCLTDALINGEKGNSCLNSAPLCSSPLSELETLIGQLVNLLQASELTDGSLINNDVAQRGIKKNNLTKLTVYVV